MTHDDQTEFGTALHERLRHEDPDLDQLIRVSTRTGTRLRRRRTAAVAVGGAAAGIVLIGIVGASLGGSDSPEGSDPGLASQPTATPVAKPTKAAVQQHQPQAQHLPVRVARSLQGWEIGIAADEKFPASRGDYFVTVVVRPMSDYASWSGGDPDHAADQIVHVADNYFVTAQPTPNVPSAVLDELVGALRYQPRWVQ